MIPGARPRLRPDLIFRQVDEDFVAYDRVTDRTVVLNTSAVAIIKLCDGTRSAAEIAAEIAALYWADAERLVAQVGTALFELARQGLLEDAEGLADTLTAEP